MRGIRSSTRQVTAIITVMVALVGLWAMPAAASEGAGAVFAMSNAAGGNQVVVFTRAGDGTLSHVADYATGGEGWWRSRIPGRGAAQRRRPVVAGGQRRE